MAPRPFTNLIKNAQGFFDYYLDRLCATNDLQSDQGQLNVARAMAERLAQDGQRRLAGQVRSEDRAAIGCGRRRHTLRIQEDGAPRQQPEPEYSESESVEPQTPPSSQESWLLKIMLLNDDLVEWLAAHLDLAGLNISGVRRVTSLCLAAHADGTWAGPAALLTQLGDDPIRGFVSELLAEARRVPNPQQQLSDITFRLRNHAIDRQMEALRQRADAPDLQETEHAEILRRMIGLKSAKSQPLRPRPKADA